jgi:hypothetical protein
MRGLHVVLGLLLLAAVAYAESRRVRITLTSGEVVEGDLAERKERTYKVTIGGKERALREDEVARVEFLDEPAWSSRPFQHVKTGDWWSYEITDWLGRAPGTSVVEDAEGDMLSLRLFPEQMFADLPFGKTTSVQRSIDGVAWLSSLGLSVTHGRVEPDRRTVLGRVFECTKVSLSLLRAGPHEKRIPMDVVAWFGKDGAPPIVAISVESTNGDDVSPKPIGFGAEIRGFGPKGTVAWGKTAAELEPKLPSDLFRSSRVGDWFVYEGTEQHTPGTTNQIRTTLRILAVDNGSVSTSVALARDTIASVQTAEATFSPSTDALGAFGGPLKYLALRSLAIADADRRARLGSEPEYLDRAGHEVACRTVTYLTTPRHQSDRHHPIQNTMRIADGIGFAGVLSFHNTMDLGYETVVCHLALVGYGNGDETYWGKR